MPAHSTTIDLIDELMYRCWARRNYLPVEFREHEWHPIILEEMADRDHELAEQDQQEVMRNTTRNWGFVPLIPTITHYVHPAHSEIREPHFPFLENLPADLGTDSIYAGGIYDFHF